jgi:hypothetical protein
MTKKELVRLIREVVKREVKTQVNNVLTEMETASPQKLTINEAIKQTEAFPTMGNKTFTAADARAGFAALQGGVDTTQQTDLNGKPVDVSQLGGGLDKALTRDYSNLVQKMNK